MAYELHLDKHQLPLVIASAAFPYQAIALGGTSVLFGLPVATNNVEPFGVLGAATAGASGLSSKEAAAVYHGGNVMKGLAFASIGVNADVEVASASGGMSYQPGQMITASANWRIGKSLTPAAAGELFSFYVSPRKA